MRIAITIRYSAQEKRYYVAKEFRKMAEELNITLIPILSLKDVAEIEPLCDALLVPGSVIDIDPKYYGQQKHPATFLDDFDVFELDQAAIKLFHEKGKKIMGVCAGLQGLNVAFGGSLYQDIKGHSETDHEISLRKDSFLYSHYQSDVITVNSLHHQGLDRIADIFRITALSPDGNVEAVEAENILGVQWHPEVMEDYDIFKDFFES